MAAYLIIYDLNKVGQNYECISKKLDALEATWRFQKSAWLVEWNGDAFSLAEALEACTDSNDLLFVTRATPDSAWSGYDAKGTDWIRSLLQ